MPSYIAVAFISSSIRPSNILSAALCRSTSSRAGMRSALAAAASAASGSLRDSCRCAIARASSTARTVLSLHRAQPPLAHE
jgi:hypothetical protein